jgi:SAM-dependent methyltransferase
MAKGTSWIDVTTLSFNTLLLLERVQLSWFPGWIPEADLAIALRGNAAVEWYMRHKCPELNEWLDKLMSADTITAELSRDVIRQAEVSVMRSLNDLIVYAVDPAIYDLQPFLNWDSNELLSLADFADKIVVDVGAGTGRLALVVAPTAAQVFAVEPVTNLRRYLKEQAIKRGLSNIFPVDGLLAEIPLPDRFADITMAGHVFGDQPEREYRELLRVTKSEGVVILCPGNNDKDNAVHDFLVSQGFAWSRFEEPQDGMKRKYWKRVGAIGSGA